MTSPDQVREIYEGILQASTKIEWVRTKADEISFFKDLAKIINLLEADPYDYISFFVDKKSHYLPKPSFLVSQVSVDRFRIHQKMKNLYVKDLYSLQGDTMMVNRTFKKYSLHQVGLPLQQDSDAEWAMQMSEDWLVPSKPEQMKDLKEAVEYLVCKLKHKEKPVPTKLLEFRRMIWQDEKESMTTQ